MKNLPLVTNGKRIRKQIATIAGYLFQKNPQFNSFPLLSNFKNQQINKLYYVLIDNRKTSQGNFSRHCPIPPQINFSINKLASK